MVHRDGEHEPYGSRPLADNEVWLKGWGENEGIPAALAKAGLVALSGERMPSGYALAELGIVDEALMVMWRSHEAETETEDEQAM